LRAPRHGLGRGRLGDVAAGQPRAGEGAELLALIRASDLVVIGQASPDYLVPSALVVLENFPLNANGKLDRDGQNVRIRLDSTCVVLANSRFLVDHDVTVAGSLSQHAQNGMVSITPRQLLSYQSVFRATYERLLARQFYDHYSFAHPLARPKPPYSLAHPHTRNPLYFS